MSNVVNLPAGDYRVGDFAQKLLDFIRSEADGLSYPAVLGCIDIAKDQIMRTQSDMLA